MDFHSPYPELDILYKKYYFYNKHTNKKHLRD